MNSDLLPLIIRSVSFGPIRLLIHPSLSLVPTLDETKKLMCAKDEDLGILAFASTRADLYTELNEEIAMLWQEYAIASDDTLDGAALKLKKHLLLRMRKLPEDQIEANLLVDAISESAGGLADEVLHMPGEFHPNWHVVRDRKFVELIVGECAKFTDPVTRNFLYRHFGLETVFLRDESGAKNV
jgi:hypothetical protein